jgi:hypothetical protein
MYEYIEELNKDELKNECMWRDKMNKIIELKEGFKPVKAKSGYINIVKVI